MVVYFVDAFLKLKAYRAGEVAQGTVRVLIRRFCCRIPDVFWYSSVRGMPG